jgi:hypothetical protein
MKSAIAAVICAQFQVLPERKPRKPVQSGHRQERGAGGRFSGKLRQVALREQEVTQEVALVRNIQSQYLEPEAPRESTVQELRNPPEHEGQEPQIPSENAVQRPKSRLEHEPGVARKLKIHPTFAIGLKA